MVQNTEEQLREQIKFEQFVNSFYLDLLVNHTINDDGYSKFVLELIREAKEGSQNEKELNTNLKNIPGIMFEKMKNGELKDLLDL